MDRTGIILQARLGSARIESIDDETPFARAAAGEVERRLERAVAALPVRYREVLLLIAVEQLEHADAAIVLGLKPDALRQRLARARKLVAVELADLAPGEARRYRDDRGELRGDA